MANTPDFVSCLDGGRDELLPIDPYLSLRVRFGMLLGVDDFETIHAYHRGKMRLHNAWLHRQGAVWGLDVQLDHESGEVRVAPGLAVDALGRELHLDRPACVHVGRWFDAQAEDPALVVEDLGSGSVRFDAHVVIRFRGCLTRQVPALVEPCDGAGQTTAYSRVFETVELLLVPGRAPARAEPPLPYHRLRLLFGLDEPREEEGAVTAADQAVLDARDDIAAAPAAERGPRRLEAFRRFAVLDAIDLQPATPEEGEEVSLFPAVDPAPLVLAELRGLTLQGEAGARTLVADTGTIDTSMRFTHVATATIEELLCACCPEAAEEEEEEEEEDDDDGGGGGGGGGGEAGGGGGGAEPPAPDNAAAAGPRADRASITRTPKRIVFDTNTPLAPASLEPEAVSVTSFDAEGGWSTVDLKAVRLSADGTRVTVDLKEAAEGRWVRLIVRGTGPRPVLGTDGVPLGAPPGNVHDGRDFVAMIERS